LTPAGLEERWAALRSSEALAGHSLRAAAAHWVALAAALIASLSMLGWVLLNCRAGFDFTDEGFYLNWISNPWNYPASLSQFGFVYHPLYVLVGSDVSLLRQANVLILFGLSWLLCITLFGSIADQPTDAGWRSRVGLACAAPAAASAVLLFLQVWLPTPNYNSLTLQSMIVTVTGGLLVGRARSAPSPAGWLMIGIGGGLAFLAKPPAAAMLGLLVAAYLAAVGRLRLVGLLIAGVTAGLVVVAAAFALDGSLAGFTRRLAEGLDLSNRRLAFVHTADRFSTLDQFVSDGQHRSHLIGFLVALFVATSLECLANRFARPVSVFLTVLIAASCVIAMLGESIPGIFHYKAEPQQILGVVLGAVLAEVLMSNGTLRVPSRNNLAIICLLLVLPCAFAVGTASGYWPTAAHAALFWLLAGLAICLDRSPANAAWQSLLPMTSVALIISAGTLFIATGAPYRQAEALNRQGSVIDLTPGQSRLFVSDQTASYIRELRQLASANGFQQGEPVLDLTGESPGSLYAIGARPLAAPWTLGGYRGSAGFVAAALDAEPCTAIAVSWLLDQPGSANSIPADVLLAQGANLPADYRFVGSVQGTNDAAPASVQYRLLKPARSAEVAEAACKKARHR
jgi:hypothetical protein